MSELHITKTQFIAAAVCPACDEVDRIVVEYAVESIEIIDEGAQLSRRRCVACGFTDEFTPADRVGFQGVPRGRPERPKTAPVNPVKVRILDPKDPGL